MKNGSVVRGKIIEQVSNTAITIKTSDGVLTYQLDEVEKFVQTSQFGGNNGRGESALKSTHRRVRQVDTEEETTLVCTTSISNRAFYNRSGLTELTITNSVTSIGNSAFADCKRLKEVPIPESVKSIDRYAFYCCKRLKEVTIGENVCKIGRYTFEACDSLKSIISLNPEPPSCGYGAFNTVDISTCILYVPKGSKKAYSNAKGWKSFKHIEEME